jgi:hypothetical protein
VRNFNWLPFTPPLVAFSGPSPSPHVLIPEGFTSPPTISTMLVGLDSQATMVGSCCLFMPNCGDREHIKKVAISQTPVQSNFDIVCTILSIIPREWEPGKSQISKTTHCNCFSEPVHLALRPDITTKLLGSLQNLIEVSCT